MHECERNSIAITFAKKAFVGKVRFFYLANQEKESGGKSSASPKKKITTSECEKKIEKANSENRKTMKNLQQKRGKL